MAVVKDTLLGHCLKRAILELAEKDIASGRRKATDSANRRDLLRAAMKATPKAGRVAGYVILWAVAMDERDGADLTVTDFIESGYESRRSAWRHNAEFRDLFPGFETPNEIGRQLIDQVHDRKRAPGPNEVELELELPAGAISPV